MVAIFLCWSLMQKRSIFSAVSISVFYINTLFKYTIMKPWLKAHSTFKPKSWTTNICWGLLHSRHHFLLQRQSWCCHPLSTYQRVFFLLLHPQHSHIFPQNALFINRTLLQHYYYAQPQMQHSQNAALQQFSRTTAGCNYVQEDNFLYEAAKTSIMSELGCLHDCVIILFLCVTSTSSNT